MQGETTGLSFKEKLAKFQGIINSAASTASNSQPIQQKNIPPPEVQTKPLNPPLMTKAGSNTSAGEVDNSPIMKSNALKKFEQINSQNNKNPQPNIQVSSQGFNTGPKQPIKTTNNEAKQAKETVVKIAQNATVQKEVLPSQNILKKLLEEKMLGLNKKVDIPSPQKKISTEEVRIAQKAPKQLYQVNSIKQTSKPISEPNFPLQKPAKNISPHIIKKQSEPSPSPAWVKAEQNKTPFIKEQTKEKNTLNIINQPNVTLTPIVTDQPTVIVIEKKSTSTQQKEIKIGEGEEVKEQETTSLLAKLKRKKKTTKVSFDSEQD